MKIIQAPRASAILYQLLVGQKHKETWLLPANICPVVPITFLKARVPFTFVDISAATLHMDLEQAEELIRKREVGGLLYAHTYGDPSTPADFFKSVKSLNPELLVVDDRCLCIPEFDISSLADVVLYSTGYAKVVDMGFGGYAYMRPGVEYHSVSLPFNVGHYVEMESSYKQAIQNGFQYDYHDSDWLQTSSDLPEWDEYCRHVQNALASALAQRESINKIYASRLPREFQLPEPYQTWRFNIRMPNQTQILKTIFDQGLFASSHYASLAGIMSRNHTPVADVLARDVINLFNDQNFDVERAERLCEIILSCRK